MIKYDLRCEHDHTFDVWFRDSAACDQQLADGEVLCPHCGSASVAKALMAPNVSTSERKEEERQRAVAMAQQLHIMREIRRQVEEKGEDVGTAFPEEARRIHYGEVEERPIYGEADLSEAKDLIEEGIDIMPIPGPIRDDA